MPPLVPLLAAVALLAQAPGVAAPPGAPPGERSVAVIAIRANVGAEDRQRLDLPALGERIRESTRRALPGVRVLGPADVPAVDERCAVKCQLAAARMGSAKQLLSGELLRIEKGLLASLELRDVSTGELLAFETALAATPDELGDSIAGATTDLLKPRQAPLVDGPGALPAVPEPLALAQPGGVLQLETSAAVLQAWDAARRADARGSAEPQQAEAAWDVLAAVGGGNNPFRDQAAARAGQWRAYADSRRAFESQLASDTDELRKILPLASVRDAARLQLLGRYAHAYGAEKARPFVPLLPAPLQERGGLVVGCEGKEAAACLSLARLDDDAKDAPAAVAHLDAACSAGAADACADSGDRLLSAPARDPARAIPALQRGCGAGSSKACARLARVYEEGDGTAANLTIASELRERACGAGDGKSCRLLGCTVDRTEDSADRARALELWQRGCERGDAVACAMAQALSGAPRQRRVRTAVAASAEAPAGAPPVNLRFAAPPPDRNRGARAAGVLLIGVGLAAFAGLALSDADLWDRPRYMGDHRGHWASVQTSAPGASAAGGAGPGGDRGHLQLAIGAAAAASAVTGLVLLLTHLESRAPAVSVGATPQGLVVSGTLP